MKKAMLILILVSLIFSTGIANAMQTKLTIKECIYSFNDNTFGAWDEASQKGVFMSLKNNNLNLGAAENPAWEWTSYQPERDYFNNFKKGNKSNMPILQVNSPGDLVYINCTIKVGNYRIYPKNWFYTYGAESDGLFLTHDFNLTTEIFSPATANYIKKHERRYNNTYSNFSYYSSSRVSGEYDSMIYYASNKINLSYYPGARDIVYSQGFYPFSEPNIITILNVSKLPSGIFYFKGLLREGTVGYFFNSNYDNYFYINSSLLNASKYILPVPILALPNIIFSNKNTSETGYGTACEAMNTCLNFSWGEVINITVDYKNEFNVPINATFSYFIYSTANSGGVGYLMTNVSEFYYTPTSFPVYNFPPLGQQTFNLLQPIDSILSGKPVVMPRIAHCMNPVSAAGGSGKSFCFSVGSDNVSYLGFNTFDPRISLKKESGIFKPVFNMTLEIYVVPNLADYDPEILPGDYNLSIELWKGDVGTGELKDTIYLSLGQNEFIRMGKTCPGACSLLQGSIFFNFNIPIKEEYLSDFASGIPYKVVVFSVKNTEPFKGYRIAKVSQHPYFKPGDIAYQVDNTLYFSNNSRADSERIILFNPSFYKADISINLTDWSDNQNFTMSLDRINFRKNIFKTFEIQPLQNYEVIFYVNSTYEPWPKYNLLEQVNFTVKATINMSSSSEDIENQLNFYLNVSNVSSPPWINLYPTGYSPRFIFLANSGVTVNKQITVNWTIDGPGINSPANIGKSYTVNVSLIDESTGLAIREISNAYTISLSKINEYLAFSHDFAEGDYWINVTLDTSDSIIENSSSGISAEDDNQRLYTDLRVRGCFYNTTDQSAYYYDWFGIATKDVNCDMCRCPGGTKCIRGSGICAQLAGSCNYAALNVCNDISTHPALDACAWNCSDGNCPPNPDIFAGECRNCSSINTYNSCRDYNNNLTCEADPCSKATDECKSKAGCSLSGAYYCSWNYASDMCDFYYATSTGAICRYTADILRKCGIGAGTGIISYTGDPAVLCPATTNEYLCPEVVKLPFFSWINLAITIFIITCLYYISALRQIFITKKSLSNIKLENNIRKLEMLINKKTSKTYSKF